MGISSLWQYLQRFQVPVANCYDPLSTKISIKDYESNSSTFIVFYFLLGLKPSTTFNPFHLPESRV